MAYKDDILKRMKRTDPVAANLIETVHRIFFEDGYRGAFVTVSHEMTPEEKEMALFEGFLREGYPEEAAALKAKQWLQMLYLIRKQSEERRKGR